MFLESKYICVLFGTLLFHCTNYLTSKIVPLKMTDSRQIWKWKNTANSLIHSVITGIGSLACFSRHPAMAEDLISNHTEEALSLVSLSVGYFIYDFFDMFLNHRKRSSFELMGHHICVILCFGLAVVMEKYVGYAVVALLVEVNSVFLHARQLFIVSGSSRSIGSYRLTALLNVATFLVFRIAVLGWMTRWLVLHSKVVPFAVYTLGCVALAVIIVMNIILFIRICTVDFYKKATHSIKREKATDLPRAAKGQAAAKVLFSQNSTVPEVHLD